MANLTWTGKVDLSASNPGNWIPSQVPGISDTLIINSATTVDFALGSYSTDQINLNSAGIVLKNLVGANIAVSASGNVLEQKVGGHIDVGNNTLTLNETQSGGITFTMGAGTVNENIATNAVVSNYFYEQSPYIFNVSGGTANFDNTQLLSGTRFSNTIL